MASILYTKHVHTRLNIHSALLQTSAQVLLLGDAAVVNGAVYLIIASKLMLFHQGRHTPVIPC